MLFPDAAESTLTATPAKIQTGMTSMLEFVAKDASERPVPGLTVTTASLTGAAAQGSSVSNWVDKHDGSYTATLTAGRALGDVHVMPMVSGHSALELAKIVNVEGTAPTASDVTIIGSAVTGQVLSAKYTYNDHDGDSEGASTYRWYLDGKIIPNEQSKNYLIAQTPSAQEKK